MLLLLGLSAKAQEPDLTNTMATNIDNDTKRSAWLTALAGGTSISATELGYLDGVSSNLQTQLNGKLATNGNGSSLTGLTASQVGLGNVDNTSDLNKPISTATQTALDGKLSLSGGTMTGAIDMGGFNLTNAPTIQATSLQANFISDSGGAGYPTLTNGADFNSSAAFNVSGIGLTNGATIEHSGMGLVFDGSTVALYNGDLNMGGFNIRDAYAVVAGLGFYGGSFGSETYASLPAGADLQNNNLYGVGTAGIDYIYGNQISAPDLPNGFIAGGSSGGVIFRNGADTTGLEWTPSAYGNSGLLEAPYFWTNNISTSAGALSIGATTNVVLAPTSRTIVSAGEFEIQTELNLGNLAGSWLRTSLAGSSIYFDGRGAGTDIKFRTNDSGTTIMELLASQFVYVPNGIELGNASDTTLGRSASGRLAVEGVDVVLNSDLTSNGLVNPGLPLKTDGGGSITVNQVSSNALGAGLLYVGPASWNGSIFTTDQDFTGAVTVTDQDPTDPSAVVNFGQGDIRYFSPDVILDGQQLATDGATKIWQASVTGSGSTAQASNYLTVTSGTTTGSTSHLRAEPSISLLFAKNNDSSLGWVFDTKWVVTFRADIYGAVNNTDGYFVLGQSIASTSTAQPSTKSCGFRFHNQGVYAFVHDGSTYTESNSSLFSLSGTNVICRYMIHCDDTNINFYINDTLADSITAPTGATGNGFQGVNFWVDNETTVNDMGIRIHGGIKFANLP